MSATSTSGIYRNGVMQGILLSQFFLQMGIWIRNFSVLLFVVEMTGGDPFAVSIISVAEFAPIFIFSFIGGAFADRWRPKRTMIWCDILSAVSVFVVLLALIFGSWQAVFFTTLFSAILSQFSQPAGLKLFKMHLPAQEIQAGMSLYQTIFAVFMVFGPVLGTFVFQTLGIYAAIALTGTTFLLSAAALLLLLPADISEGSKVSASLLKEMAAGVRYLLSKKTLTLLGASFLVAGLALGLIQPMGVFLVTERLGMEKEFLKWLLTFYGLGMIMGGGLAAVFAKATAPQKLLIFGMFFDAAGIAICGVSTTAWLTLAGQFISGLVFPCISIGINTIMLQNTDHHYVGRVNGILSPLFTGAMVITMGMAGLLKKMFSLVAIYETASMLFIVSLLFILPLYSLPAIQSSHRRPRQENV